MALLICLSAFFHAISQYFAKALLILLLCGTIGLTSAKFEDWRNKTRMLGGQIHCQITAKLLDMPSYKSGRYHLRLQILDSSNRRLWFLPKIVEVSCFEIPKDLDIGNIIKARVLLHNESGALYYGAYDFAFYSYYKHIGAAGFLLSKIELIKQHENDSYITKIKNNILQLRHYIENKISSVRNDENSAIAIALITGNRDGISKDTVQALRIAGLAHILAISGLHMSMVTGIVFFIVRYLLVLYVPLGQMLPAKKIAAILAIIISFCYFVISGASSSAQRSFVMVSIILLAIILDKQAITIRNVAIAVWSTILLAPHYLLDPSFQMSYAAAAALVKFYGYYKYRTEEFHDTNRAYESNFIIKKMLDILKAIYNNLTAIAVASFVAGLATSVFAIYHFGNLSPLGVLSNVLAAGLISIFVMPLVLLTVLTMPFGLYTKPLDGLCYAIEGVKKVAFTIASITPYIDVKYMDNSSFIYLVAALCWVLVFRSWLQSFGLILFLKGCFIYYNLPIPIAVISENAKSAIFITPQHIAYSYNNRSPSFTLSNWQKSFLIKQYVKNNSSGGFSCNQSLCSLKQKDANFYIIKDQSIYNQISIPENKMNIILLLGSDTRSACNREGKNLVITAKDLVLKGGAMIYKDGSIKWAAYPPNRSWNRYRKYIKIKAKGKSGTKFKKASSTRGNEDDKAWHEARFRHRFDSQ